MSKSIYVPRSARSAASASKIEISKACGDLLRDWRQRRGLTAAQVGASINIPPETIIAWEHEEGRPSPTQLQELAAALGAPFYYFLDGDDTYHEG